MNLGSLFFVLVAAISGSQSAVLSGGQARADAIVQDLLQLPAPRRVSGAVEERRMAIHSQLRDLGEEGIAALARALADENLMLRRNALLALYDLGHGVARTGRVAKVDIRSAVPALITAFRDPDASVRAWSIQALTAAEPVPLTAVPALDEMLQDPAPGVRLSACAAVGQLGVAAAQVKENLQRLLNDQHQDVRTCAGFVLKKISK